MAKDLEIAHATPADLAADMEYHRKIYRTFLNIAKYSIVIIAIVLIILFLNY